MRFKHRVAGDICPDNVDKLKKKKSHYLLVYDNTTHYRAGTIDFDLEYEKKIVNDTHDKTLI